MAPRVLLVEDEHTLREALAEVLRAEGYDVLAVGTGQAALDAFTGAPESFQCAVLDCLIPKPDGLEVAARMRGTRPDLPLIMISGIYKSPNQQNDARERLGARAFLVKPFDTKRLIDAVRAVAPTAPAATTKAQAAVAVAPLPAEGRLLEAPVPYLLWRAERENHTGILELFAPPERARIFLVRGRAVLAQHSDPSVNVGVELIRSGDLTAEQFGAATALAAERSIGLVEVLRAEAWVTEAQLKEAYKPVIHKTLEKVVAWIGHFRFTPTDQFMSVVPCTQVPLMDAVQAAIRPLTAKDLAAHVDPRRPLRLAPGDAWWEVTPRLVPACGSDTLVKSINGRATIAMMLEAGSSEAERDARHRQVFLLMSTMAVRASLEPIVIASASPAAAPQPAADPAARGPAPVEMAASPAPTAATPSEPAFQPALQRGGPPRVPTPVAHSPIGGPPPVRAPTPASPPAAAPAPANPAPAPRPVQGASAGTKPTIDLSADAGLAFTEAEQAARAKIAVKFAELTESDLYAVLGVPREADAAAIRRAYIALARDFHTDAFAGLALGAAQRQLDHVFSTIQTAYDTLTDPAQRGEYDARRSFEMQGASTDIAAILTAESELHKARLLVDRGELSAALRIIDKILPIMPANDELLGYRAYCAWWQKKNPGDIATVIRDLQKYHAAAPGALSLREFQGWLFLEAGDLKNARSAFTFVLDRERNHAGAGRGMRQVQRKQEEAEKKASSGLGRFLKR